MKPAKILLIATGLAVIAGAALMIAAPASTWTSPGEEPALAGDLELPADETAAPSPQRTEPPSSGSWAPAATPQSDTRGLPGRTKNALGEAGGALPDHATVFDSAYPGIANLDQALLKALHQAAKDAERDNVVFYVSSGWRSAAYQEQLLQQAIATYGSAEEAAKWVAAPDKSLHVLGGAIDIDGVGAKEWLAHNGAQYGLCLVYANEPWHFELRPQAKTAGCPELYPDPTHDPRLR
ncbi:MAG: D-alanyl-D-alanine carboxypeptidase family protein [Bifidobacteriaceae bacterium]|jgi:hypothetical protein|nr:D-alanyl-D-alanine carboxypeptidase family protein [Bifidobacteriaceae bacterium]